jgi:hypothetical protein
LEDKELALIIKKVPRAYWYNKNAQKMFEEVSIFLKNKGLENEEIKSVLEELYKAAALNNGFSFERMA